MHAYLKRVDIADGIRYGIKVGIMPGIMTDIVNAAWQQLIFAFLRIAARQSYHHCRIQRPPVPRVGTWLGRDGKGWCGRGGVVGGPRQWKDGATRMQSIWRLSVNPISSCLSASLLLHLCVSLSLCACLPVCLSVFDFCHYVTWFCVNLHARQTSDSPRSRDVKSTRGQKNNCCRQKRRTILYHATFSNDLIRLTIRRWLFQTWKFRPFAYSQYVLMYSPDGTNVDGSRSYRWGVWGKRVGVRVESCKIVLLCMGTSY